MSPAEVALWLAAVDRGLGHDLPPGDGLLATCIAPGLLADPIGWTARCDPLLPVRVADSLRQQGVPIPPVLARLLVGVAAALEARAE